MKITLAALAVLLAAAPSYAQVKAEAKGASAKRVSAVESLFERLIKDGDALETPTGTHLYLEVRRRGSETGAIAASVQEFPVPEPEGPYRDLAYRRSFSGVLQITEQDQSIGKDGAATLESRTYVVSLDGRVIQVMATRIPARVEKDGSLTLDQSKTETKTEDAKSADTLKRWKALEKELVFIAKTVEA
jgi:hypothetical protein